MSVLARIKSRAKEKGEGNQDGGERWVEAERKRRSRIWRMRKRKMTKAIRNEGGIKIDKNKMPQKENKNDQLFLVDLTTTTSVRENG